MHVLDQIRYRAHYRHEPECRVLRVQGTTEDIRGTNFHNPAQTTMTNKSEYCINSQYINGYHKQISRNSLKSSTVYNSITNNYIYNFVTSSPPNSPLRSNLVQNYLRKFIRWSGAKGHTYVPHIKGFHLPDLEIHWEQVHQCGT